MYREFFHSKLTDARSSGDQIYGRCPFHDDAKASFSANIQIGLWKCHGCDAKGNVSQFAERLGIEPPSLAYVYEDESGNPLFRVVRSHPKNFSQERFEDGEWIKGLNGTQRVLYRLPDILDKKTVYIVEGEKDADRLWSIGIPATCNPGGAGKWQDEFSENLRDKQIVILPDNDSKGSRHAILVARSLVSVSDKIKLVNLPDLPEKGDISDWLNAGHTKEELFEYIANTPALDRENLPSVEETPVTKSAIPAELKERRIHPAIHIEPGFASVGVAQTISGKLTYSIITSTGKMCNVEQIKDLLTTPHQPHPGLSGRWASVQSPLSLSDSVGLLVGKMRDLVSFEDERWYSAAALWCAGTYLFPAFPAFPYFQLTGEKGSGKTKIQDILVCVCFNAIKVVNPTPAVLFRIVQSLRPTLLLDEAEGIKNDESGAIRDILNAGYKPGNPVPRVIGDSFEIQFFEVYSPKSFASINSLGSVTEDRCITAVMSRPPKADPRQNKSIDPRDPEWSQIRSGLYQLPFTHAEKVLLTLNALSLPDWLLARERELWLPIFWLASQADQESDLRLSEDVQSLARETLKNKGFDFDTETVLSLLEEKLGDQPVIRVRPGELVEELNKRLGRKVDPTWVGQKFRTLGFPKTERVRQGQPYEIHADQIRELGARYAA